MVSALMQGGSVCENAPNLRIDTTNVEIAALFAPRPMLLIAATGDWTKNVPRVEFPAIRNIYQLFDAEDQVQVVQIDAPHNYNQASREAVYGWFAHWLQGRAATAPLKERGITVAPLGDLLVFHERPRPTGEANETQLIETMMTAAQKQWQQAQPQDAVGLQRLQELYRPALQGALLASYPRADQLIVNNADAAGSQVELKANAHAESLFLEVMPAVQKALGLTLVVAASASDALVQTLRAQGQTVISLSQFTAPQPAAPPDIKFFTTYNRTTAARRVQDILTALAFAQQQAKGQPVNLIATGEAGLWALLARGLAPPLAHSIIDVNQFANTDDAAFIAKLPIPGLRRAGDFTTATALAGTTPLRLYQASAAFDATALRNLYRVAHQSTALQITNQTPTATEIAAWLRQ